MDCATSRRVPPSSTDRRRRSTAATRCAAQQDQCFVPRRRHGGEIGRAAPVCVEPGAPMMHNHGVLRAKSSECGAIPANPSTVGQLGSAWEAAMAQGFTRLTRGCAPARDRCAPARDRRRLPAALRTIPCRGSTCENRHVGRARAKKRASGRLLIHSRCLVLNHRPPAFFWVRKLRACRCYRAAPKRYVAVLSGTRILASTNGAH